MFSNCAVDVAWMMLPSNFHMQGKAKPKPHLIPRL